MIEVDKKYKALFELLCKAIKNKNLLKVYYESESRKGWRTVKPYMIWQNPIGNLSLAVEPLDFKVDKKDEIISGQYLLSQLLQRLDEGRLEVLSDKFDTLRIPRDRVDNTKTKVICRFIYNDEVEQDVISQWLKVQYV